MKKNLMMRVASALLVAVLLTTCAISGTFAKYVTSATSNDHARVAYWGFRAENNSLPLTDLFSKAYKYADGAEGGVISADEADVIAPGTTGTIEFTFAWDGATSATRYTNQNAPSDATDTVAVTFADNASAKYGPEVAYEFSIEVEQHCDELIQKNENILWKLDNGSFGTWGDLIADIKNLSGDADGTMAYGPNTLPGEFNTTNSTHTITWKWIFDAETVDNDVYNGTYAVTDATTTNYYNQDEYDTLMANAAVLDDVYIKITITVTQID